MKKFAKSVYLLFRGEKQAKSCPTYEELVEVPERNLGTRKALEDEDYYHGFIMEDEVVEMLRKKRKGSFLLRKVQTFQGLNFLLSVKGLHVFHVLINVTNTRGLYWIDMHAFRTIQHLIAFYMETGIAFRVHHPNFDSLLEIQLKYPIYRLGWQLNHEQVEMDRYLSEGAFGEVFKGTLELSFHSGHRTVAVKRLKEGDLTAQQMFDLLKEADYMKKLNHKHVVKFYGIASSRNPFIVALEFCHGGSLESKLENCENVSQFDKIRYLYHAALGIHYLHEVGIVHGDIAARNCLLTSSDILKISDFGLSAGRGGGRHKGDLVPIRYMAPEALERLISTRESDVWAFSVVMFEVFHRAVEPFVEYWPRENVMEWICKNEIQLYLFERPDVDYVAPDMEVVLELWTLSMDKPDLVSIQLEMEILFKHIRFRNVKHRAVFERNPKNGNRSILDSLENMVGL